MWGTSILYSTFSSWCTYKEFNKRYPSLHNTLNKSQHNWLLPKLPPKSCPVVLAEQELFLTITHDGVLCWSQHNWRTMIFPEYFYFTSQALLPKCPNIHLNRIFNRNQHIKPSKEAENGLLITMGEGDQLLAEQNDFTALVLKFVGVIQQFLLTYKG